MIDEGVIQLAHRGFETVLREQLERVERLKGEGDWVDYSAINPIVVGMIGGDGIGPTISEETHRVLEYLLRGEVERGKVEFRDIDGLTIENRAARMQSIPDLKQSSHVDLLGLLVVRIQRSPFLRSQQGSSHLCSVGWVSCLRCNEEQ